MQCVIKLIPQNFQKYQRILEIFFGTMEGEKALWKKTVLGILAFVCVSCGYRGVVVYERVDGKWQVKEVHLEMQHIHKEAVWNP